jgi:hypothetical protein
MRPGSAPSAGRVWAAHWPTTGAGTLTGDGPARGCGRAGASPSMRPCAAARCGKGVEWRIDRCAVTPRQRGCRGGRKGRCATVSLASRWRGGRNHSVVGEERGAEGKLGREKCVMWLRHRRRWGGVWRAGASRGTVEERGHDTGQGEDTAEATAGRRTLCEAGENSQGPVSWAGTGRPAWAWPRE